MKLYSLLLFTFLQSAFLFSQVGIGTTNPTQELDVDGDARVRGLTHTSPTALGVSALQDGTLVTSATATNTIGTRFVGAITNDIEFTNSFPVLLTLGNELLDVGNEYNTANGEYIPAESGLYKISLEFDVGAYTSTTLDVEIILGLWNLDTPIWEVRRSFAHRSTNLFSFFSFRGRNQTYSSSGFANLTAGTRYSFRTIVTHSASGLSASNRLDFRAANNGTSAVSSPATVFIIERIN